MDAVQFVQFESNTNPLTVFHMVRKAISVCNESTHTGSSSDTKHADDALAIPLQSIQCRELYRTV